MKFLLKKKFEKLEKKFDKEFKYKSFIAICEDSCAYITYDLIRKNNVVYYYLTTPSKFLFTDIIFNMTIEYEVI